MRSVEQANAAQTKVVIENQRRDKTSFVSSVFFLFIGLIFQDRRLQIGQIGSENLVRLLRVERRSAVSRKIRKSADVQKRRRSRRRVGRLQKVIKVHKTLLTQWGIQ
jgi:hypothetical protein